MKIIIKNMICPCCRTVVITEMEKIGLIIKFIDANEVETEDDVSEKNLLLLQKALTPFGFELLHDRKSKIIEKIKIIISALVNNSDEEEKINLSECIRKNIKYNHNYLSKIFKEKTGTTIEKYFISKKIERVKNLLQTDDISLSEIAYRMQYSSLAHLSNQFKKVTGLQPSYFRQYKDGRQKISATA
jgi:YesN/AraC family two-component response regulator